MCELVAPIAIFFPVRQLHVVVRALYLLAMMSFHLSCVLLLRLEYFPWSSRCSSFLALVLLFSRVTQLISFPVAP